MRTRRKLGQREGTDRDFYRKVRRIEFVEIDDDRGVKDAPGRPLPFNSPWVKSCGPQDFTHGLLGTRRHHVLACGSIEVGAEPFVVEHRRCLEEGYRCLCSQEPVPV